MPEPRDVEQIFANATASFKHGGVAGGVRSLTAWGEVFAAMHAGLLNVSASPERCRQFMQAISQAIDDAAPDELTDPERAALHEVLASAFDGIPRSVPTYLAPRAGFLRLVRFS
jgi:hypothetical protein